MNSIPETIVAQSVAVQSAVAIATAPSSVADDAKGAAEAASAAAVSANSLTEEEFDPFLFIKNLPPLSQAIRTCQVPVLPPLMPISSANGDGSTTPRLSLALDLDETLVHCSIEPLKKFDLTFDVFFNGQAYRVYVALRPHLFKFLDEVRSAGFEIIIFTASQKIYADKLLGLLDPINETGSGKYFHHRIFRDSCVEVEGNYLKVRRQETRHMIESPTRS